MSGKVKVGIIGHRGRLGAAATAWINDSQDLELTGCVGASDDWALLRDAAVVLEVTRAGLGAAHGRRLIELGVRPVIGTSGVSDLEHRELDAMARAAGIGGALIPNFSLGQLAMEKAITASRELFDSAAVTEAHRASKSDAPSGTAKSLCKLLGLADGAPVSVRLDGVTAAHEVRLSGDDDSLLFRHESHGLMSFKRGLLASLRYAANASGIALGLEQVLAEA